MSSSMSSPEQNTKSICIFILLASGHTLYYPLKYLVFKSLWVSYTILLYADQVIKYSNNSVFVQSCIILNSGNVNFIKGKSIFFSVFIYFSKFSRYSTSFSKVLSSCSFSEEELIHVSMYLVGFDIN